MAEKPWGGRFEGTTDKSVEDFTTSLSFDRRLARQDIAGSMAHARMLAQQGIITAGGRRADRGGADRNPPGDRGRGVRVRPGLGRHPHGHRVPAHHPAGEVGKKLHTARSRNDQVALDVRLYLAEEVEGLINDLADLRLAGVRLAHRHQGVIMPGYTHLQRAQPILFAHHLLAYDEMWRRDIERLHESLQRIKVSPLGAAALAGTTFPIDPAAVAAELGFPRVFRNSLDAVSDRDFLLEFAAHASIIMVHLSRLAEELILWSASEFGFVALPDAYATGSSIMPQKKNPDVPELIRGKCGRVAGHLLGLLMIMKGLPLAYNRDLQEDKEHLFDTVDTVRASVTLMAGLVENLTVRPEKMAAALHGGFLTATDLADYLVTKGTPFRTAHEQVGNTVRYAEVQGRELWELSLTEIQQFAPEAEPDVFDWLKIENSVARRRSPGGTAPERVRRGPGTGRSGNRTESA